MRKDDEKQPTEGERPQQEVDDQTATIVARRLTELGVRRGIYGVKGGRTRGGGIAPEELSRIREGALRKVAEGRNHELTTLEAGSLGGSLNRDLYSVIHRIAGQTGKSVTEVVDVLMQRAEQWEAVLDDEAIELPVESGASK